MKIKFTIIAAFLFPVLVNAQSSFQIDKPPLPIDSLKKVLPSLYDSARVDCLNEIARSYAEEEIPSLFDSAWSKGTATANCFSCIEMPGMHGFEMLEKLPEIHFEIIFTTSSQKKRNKLVKNMNQ
ncbi:MAG TPA: hypothetical protein VI461_12910 [Chitinophagaceae bacterium]|nr:hypothetical protein [Chitinophagaceae bacterium]